MQVLEFVASCKSDLFNDFSEWLFKEVAHFPAAKRTGMNIPVWIHIQVTVTCPETPHFTLMVSEKGNDGEVPEAWIIVHHDGESR